MGLSEGLFSGRLRRLRGRKISNFGLRRPENRETRKKKAELLKMSVFVMAFYGVPEKKRVFRSHKIRLRRFLMATTHSVENRSEPAALIEIGF